MRGLVGLLLTAGLAAAQEQPVSHTNAAPATQPGSQGWPPLASPTVPPQVPSGGTVREARNPGSELPQYPPGATEALVAPAATDLGYAPMAERPAPGSWADQFAREYEQRQLFRSCDYFGNRYTLFPTSLLWDPPLADPRSPRLGVVSADDKTIPGKYDLSLGQTLGLVRIDRNGVDGAIQLDLFGAAFSRFDGGNLVATDFRAGVPLTFRRGAWFSRLAYEHTSSYLGDPGTVVDPQAALLPARPRYRKDEVVIGLGRWFEDTFRIYGQAAYAFEFTDDRAAATDDSSKRKQRYQLGAEWFPWGLYAGGGFGGQPFVAVNGDFRGETNFSGDLTAQAGWIWRNPLQRLASLRVYVQYYSGRPVYGQFSRFERSSYGGLGVACDY